MGSVIFCPAANSVYGCNVSTMTYNGSGSCIAGVGKEEEVHITYHRKERQIVHHVVLS